LDTNPRPEVQLESGVDGRRVVHVRGRSAVDTQRHTDVAGAASAVSIADGALVELTTAESED
jgi:hypothetical protein